MKSNALLAGDVAAVDPAVIIFGLDDNKRPHASCFGADLADQAEAAAKVMGFASLRPVTAATKGVAATLALGKVFASGRAFVPFVRAEVFDELTKLAPTGAVEAAAKKRIRVVASGASAPSPKTAADAPPPSKANDLRLPRDWMTIAVDCVVLAFSEDEGGWFECIVTKIEQNDVFELRWKDYPDEPKIYRHRKKLGLLHPEYVAS